jgi:adenylate cyclase
LSQQQQQSSSDRHPTGLKGWLRGTLSEEYEKRLPPDWERTRIAILPFANISPDANDEYFADGLTEELISTMSKISGLKVIARTSVMSYKGEKKKIGDVARELEVGTLLEGSVRRAGGKA